MQSNTTHQSPIFLNFILVLLVSTLLTVKLCCHGNWWFVFKEEIRRKVQEKEKEGTDKAVQREKDKVPIREWDRNKIRQSRSRSRERRRKLSQDRSKSRERRRRERSAEKKSKKGSGNICLLLWFKLLTEVIVLGILWAFYRLFVIVFSTQAYYFGYCMQFVKWKRL